MFTYGYTAVHWEKDDVTSFVSGLQYVESLMLYTSLSLLTLRKRLQI